MVRATFAHTSLLRRCIAPLTASGVTVLRAGAGEVRLAVVVGAVFATADALLLPRRVRGPHMRLTRAVFPLAAPAAAVTALLVLCAMLILPKLAPSDVLLIGAGAAASAVAVEGASWRRRRTTRTPIRTAIVGTGPIAEEVSHQLRLARVCDFDVVGYVVAQRCDAMPDTGLMHLGSLEDLQAIAARHRVELLLLSSEVTDIAFFDEMASAGLETTVRAMSLSAFYEYVFAHVPLATINAAWLQCLIDPRSGQAMSAGKRALDVVLGAVVAVVAAPLLFLLVALIKLDGGPVLYRQVRVGERGRRFQMLKLRTMVHAPERSAAWAIAGDPRVTRLGRVLRRTHLDELPQVVNVIRGEMSLVGPRPEQPGYVASLERQIPFYSRRHLARPGLTGWAQIACGYAGSESGAAWKLAHDLYYLKYRSLALDIFIIIETLRTFVFDRQFAADSSVSTLVYTRPPALADQ